MWRTRASRSDRLAPGVAVRLPKRAFDLRDVVRMNQVEDAGAGELLGLPADHACKDGLV